MKRLAFIILLFATLSVSAETYYVIRVMGVIKIKTTGAVLKPGDKIDSEDKLEFGSKDAKAAVMSRSKGRFTLELNAKQKSSGEFVAFMKSCLTASKGQLSTRAGAILNLQDLQKHFAKEKYLVLGTAKIPVSDKAFIQDDQHFFFIRYTYNDEEVNKLLEHDGDTLILEKGSLFMVDDQPVPEEAVRDMKLYHYNAEKEESIYITDIDLLFPDMEEINTEIAAMVALMDKRYTQKEKKAEIETYLREFYGQPGSDNFDDWVKQFDL